MGLAQKLNAIWVFVVWFLQYLLPSTLRVERMSIQIPELKCGRLRIIHLSDFHYDVFKPERISKDMLDRVVEITNAHHPDLVLLTGDYVEYNATACQELAQKWLSRFTSKFGTYAVLGNHDYKEGARGRDMIIKSLSEVGIKVLTCEHTCPIEGDPSFELVGLGDWTSRQYGINDFRVEDAFAHVSPNLDHGTRVVLSHQPDSAKNLINFKVDLQLSGHVHGGQICLPWNKRPLLYYIRKLYDISPNFLRRIFPRQIFVVSNWLWAEGLHTIPRKNNPENTNQVYINRGLATHPPFRLFCPAEVAIIDLHV